MNGYFEIKNWPSLVSDICAYEEGDMDSDDIRSFFQRLLDTGMIHHLQGHYQRTANALVMAGEIVDPASRV